MRVIRAVHGIEGSWANIGSGALELELIRRGVGGGAADTLQACTDAHAPIPIKSGNIRKYKEKYGKIRKYAVNIQEIYGGVKSLIHCKTAHPLLQSGNILNLQKYPNTITIFKYPKTIKIFKYPNSIIIFKYPNTIRLFKYPNSIKTFKYQKIIIIFLQLL